MSMIDEAKIYYVIRAINEDNRTVYACTGDASWGSLSYSLSSAKTYKTILGAEKGKEAFEKSKMYAMYKCKDAKVMTVEEAEKIDDYSYSVIYRNGHFYLSKDLSFFDPVEIDDGIGKNLMDTIKTLLS